MHRLPALCYIAFVLLHASRYHPNCLEPHLVAAKYGLCGCLVALCLLAALSLGLPLLLLEVLSTELEHNAACRRCGVWMIAASLAVYVVDIAQDALVRWFAPNVLRGCPCARLKYAMHLLVAPIFFLDIVYHVALDRKNEAPRAGRRRQHDLVLFLFENTLVLVYIALAACIFLHSEMRAGQADIRQILRAGHAYFVLQLLICAVTVLISALLFSHLAKGAELRKPGFEAPRVRENGSVRSTL
ncbi:hypothetical protein PAPHI01_1134 [Pancytospora philotis]|nr:hypothetical protein PAPHI01_1134 [Pancytospora philotis]